MKRRINKKLALNRETLRELSGSALQLAVGGITEGGPSNCTDSCPRVCDPSLDCTANTNCCTGNTTCC